MLLPGQQPAPSMSQRGNCQDNSFAKSFFNSLKKERLRKKVNKTRNLARGDIFYYIEYSTTGPGATATSVESVQRTLIRPRP